jgi:hypothetical protein
MGGSWQYLVADQVSACLLKPQDDAVVAADYFGTAHHSMSNLCTGGSRQYLVADKFCL